MKKGFTFIETVLYIALTTMVVGFTFSYGWNIVSLRAKANTVRDTLAGARSVSEKLERELRSIRDVDTEQSFFDGLPGRIAFASPDGDVVIESDNDKISIKRDGGSPQIIHGNSVRMRNFILTKQENDGEEIIYVGFSFDAEAYYPEAGDDYEYNFSIPTRGGTEVRSR